MKPVVLAAVLLGGCKSREVAPEHPQPAASKPVEIKRKPVIGTSLTAVPCNLTDKPREGSNNVAATRHLHRGPRNELYFFPDFRPPTLLEPTTEGCGYRSTGAMAEKPDHEFALQPDGAIVLVPRSDDSKKTACRTRALDSIRYGHGRLVGGTYYYRDTGALKRMKLDDEQCAAEEVTTLKELPANALNAARVGYAGNDLLIGVPRQDWKWSQELYRFDAKGTFVRKYGAAEGKGELHGEMTGCGDGFCTSGYARFEVYDRDGMRVGSASLSKLSNLKNVYISGVVDVPDKGVYVLIGHDPEPKGDGRAELVRVDGVH